MIGKVKWFNNEKGYDLIALSSYHKQNFISIGYINKIYNPIISRTMRSEILIVPTNTNILKISSPIYFHTCVTAAALVSTTGGLEANKLNIIHDKIIIAPSKQTAA